MDYEFEERLLKQLQEEEKQRQMQLQQEQTLIQ